MEAYIATIMPFAGNFAPVYYLLAQGQQIAVAQYQAVYAIIGASFGGSGNQYFNLPDLRGRSMVGAGTSPDFGTNYQYAQKQGRETVQLTQANLAAHNHAAQFTPVLGSTNITIPAQTAAGSQTASVKMPINNNVAGSAVVDGSSNNVLAMVAAGSNKASLYTTTTPTSATTLAEVSAPVTASSDYSPAIAQKTVAVSGLVTGGNVAIGNNGNSMPFDCRSPSLTLNFLFCMQGLFPTRE